MSKFDEQMDTYKKEFDKLGISYNEELLRKVTKGLGPSIYNADSSKVSCSDQTELDRVKNNFLIKKLGLKDSAKLDSAIQDVCKKFGSSRRKFRAMFYYLLVKDLKQEGFYK